MTVRGTLLSEIDSFSEKVEHLLFDAPLRVGWQVFFAFSRQAGNAVWFSVTPIAGNKAICRASRIFSS
jgi:hypothetical protein